MAAAFSEQEKNMILCKLKEAARQYAAVVGIRRTTVDQLVEAADISKGAFYKFYPSKEMLFFELLEDLHTEIYQAAAETLEKNAALPPADRVAEAVLAACRVMEAAGMMDFMEKDVPYLLRKIPQEIQQKHYHSDEIHVGELLHNAGLEPKGGISLASATVRGLMLTVSHRDSIGDQYPQVLETLVRGACRQLF